MNIIKTRDLSEDMINQINSIVEAQDKEYHNNIYEIIAFTDTANRKKG